MIPWLDDEPDFPPLERALAEPNGLLAAGGRLDPAWLVTAYRRGIFPWFGPGDPILWWSPDPRMVLVPGELRISRSLRRRLRRGGFDVRFDTAFGEVIRACAEPREPGGGTWITAAMQRAYLQLHELGIAHSVETFEKDRLVGGLYGVALGAMFYGESMFARVSDASKVALAHLAAHLERQGFGLIDCQMSTAHLSSLGGREIPRTEFARRVHSLVGAGVANARWPADATADLTWASPTQC